jgi:hypothetical protein
VSAFRNLDWCFIELLVIFAVLASAIVFARLDSKFDFSSTWALAVLRLAVFTCASSKWKACVLWSCDY